MTMEFVFDMVCVVITCCAVAATMTYARQYNKCLQQLRQYEQYDMTPEELRQCLSNYSEYLCFTTGGRLSKIGYDVPTMESVATDYWTEREEAKWVQQEEEDEWVCSNCGHTEYFFDGDQPNFCSKCGAKMVYDGS